MSDEENLQKSNLNAIFRIMLIYLDFIRFNNEVFMTFNVKHNPICLISLCLLLDLCNSGCGTEVVFLV